MTQANRFLLYTNVFIFAARGGLVWEKIKAVCNPLTYEPKGMVCIVMHGELRAFAELNTLGTRKRSEADFLVSYLDTLDINHRDVIDAYALLDTHSRKIGVRMGKNDLWIAATAHVYGATIITDR